MMVTALLDNTNKELKKYEVDKLETGWKYKTDGVEGLNVIIGIIYYRTN